MAARVAVRLPDWTQRYDCKFVESTQNYVDFINLCMNYMKPRNPKVHVHTEQVLSNLKNRPNPQMALPTPQAQAYEECVLGWSSRDYPQLRIATDIAYGDHL